jgi:hypothetical protein
MWLRGSWVPTVRDSGSSVSNGSVARLMTRDNTSTVPKTTLRTYVCLKLSL